MYTGMCFWFGFPIPSKERFKLIASVGFDNVFFWWGDHYLDIDGPKEKLPELARNVGLSVENIHTDFEHTNLLWVDKLGWEDVLNRYIASVDACYNYQIPTMILHLTNGDNPPAASDLGIARIKRIVERAEQKNINIALENLRKPEYLDYVYERIKSDNLKFCYDSGHENCFSKKGDLLDKFGNKLIALHLHDNDGTDDQHRIIGEGNVNWVEITKKLKKYGYHGSISLEVTNEFSLLFKDLSAENFLVKAYKHAEELACAVKR
jgi:sugar phosphate isomerase/epimerase